MEDFAGHEPVFPGLGFPRGKRCGAMLVTLLMTWLGAIAPAAAGPTVIDFDDLLDGVSVTTQYAGLTFTNTAALTAGVSLNELEFPPRSGLNVISDDGGPIEIAFSSVMTSIVAYLTYTERVTLQVYDGQSLVGSITSAFAENYLSSGNAPNETLEFVAPGGFTHAVFAGAPGGYSLTLDDLTFETRVGNSVPEPSSLMLLAVGLIGLCLRKSPARH